MTDYKIGDLVEAKFNEEKIGEYTIRGLVWYSRIKPCVANKYLSQATDVKVVERKRPDEPDVNYVIDDDGAVWTNYRPGWRTKYMTYPTSWKDVLDRVGTVYYIESGAEIQ